MSKRIKTYKWKQNIKLKNKTENTTLKRAKKCFKVWKKFTVHHTWTNPKSTFEKYFRKFFGRR